uniref:Uncharacterized protein n=1 Tax=viral metagenome TaxID=1070528 RepID=A0A6M3K4B7_9ZZZZ
MTDKIVVKTIAFTEETHKRIVDLKMPYDPNYEAVIKRLIDNVGAVYFEPVLVDNELPQTHTIVFQLGEDKTSLYLFDGEKISPITLDVVQMMVKQPKPNITINCEDASLLLRVFKFFKPSSGLGPKSEELCDRIAKFLEAHESE